MVNAWVLHIKAFAAKHKIAYGCALSNPDCRASYKKKKPSARSLLLEVDGILKSDLSEMEIALEKKLKRSSPDTALDFVMAKFGYTPF